MKYLFSVAALLSTVAPVAGHSTPVSAPAKQAICIPAEITTESGTISGMFCYREGERL
ncbi:hypothetical protein [Sphingomonas sp. S2-65]|uniref:hypothetical protein n=1 Tax=Sphingomonas sp. S2-65 TaxID=2903960 RepID=UPI001F46E88B|nr:hypothetical protein [Sphingomonas sp. S2-65]UYY57149.1 hypothetical protein LZ586_10670 [Sphingomonas sp. S2-65]